MIMNEKRLSILEDAVSKFGTVNQLDMAIEECAELIQAINKIKRTFPPETISQFYREYNSPQMPRFQSESDALIYHGLCGEIADVEILLEQMRLIFNTETIDLIKERKLMRLQERLYK